MLLFIVSTMLFSVTIPTRMPLSTTGYLLKCFVSIILLAFSSLSPGLRLVIGELIIFSALSREEPFLDIRFFRMSDSVIMPSGLFPSTTTTQQYGLLAISFAASETLASLFSLGTSADIIPDIVAMY